MPALLNFVFAFFFSFIGSIPPGTINLTVIQLGLEKNINVVWRFALAAGLIEYPYAWLAVKFEKLITSSPWIIDNIHLLTAIVMTILGVINLLPSSENQSKFTKQYNASGFRRGLLLSILNPLAIPYWIGITAYLRSQNWIDLDSNIELHAYLLGVSLGAVLILLLFAYVAKRIIGQFIHNKWLKRIPGITLLLLGIYAFIEYML
jgi:threonine/homoserine/homoserine lactone efflux protein